MMASRIANLIHKKYNIKTDVIEIPNVTRIDLAEFLAECGFEWGIEVGVAAGRYSEALMKANPALHLGGVDPYTPYKGYRDYTRLGTFDSLEKQAHERLDKYPRYEFLKMTSMEAVAKVLDESLDFVYIDGNHSEPYVSQDIEAWTTKVRKGGIVAGDDYARIKGSGGEDSSNWAVIPAITKYAKDHNYQLYIWGLETKLPGLKRDASRSWMFIR
jgi:hypothetical protein